MSNVNGTSLMQFLGEIQDRKQFQTLNWRGSFADYLDLVAQNPAITRNAFQRIYDMIMAYGTEEFIDAKKRLIRYRFFSDQTFDGDDAIFGLEVPLMRLVNFFKGAAKGYGTEKRVLLLHGPVGSSKSTIVRRLKKGLEHYSKTDAGTLYTYDWYLGQIEHPESFNWNQVPEAEWEKCPMHEEPLHLIPLDHREDFLARINAGHPNEEHVQLVGDLCPVCRFHFRELMRRYDGDWLSVIRHIRVRRLLFSEQDRVGIGTFQPKDEKNQDSTELTGDINYRKIAIYGSDSDPRAFNFDGEFNIANRGIIEFVEMLKLDVAFLYDLLGASQEHRIKSKKFAQTDIDEVILGHSVVGETPIAYRFREAVRWTTLAELYTQFELAPEGLEVLAYSFADQRVRWTPVRALFRHRFSGDIYTTAQKWGVVATTPNHSIYDRQGQAFYPEERHEIMALRRFDAAFTPEETMSTIDLAAGVTGLVSAAQQPGWARLDQPHEATAVRAIYDPASDAEALKDLLTVLAWYATRGHLSEAGVLISQAERNELARVQAAYARISTAHHGSSGEGDLTGNTEITLAATAFARLAAHHCGQDTLSKRLPDFLFGLSHEFIQHTFTELLRADGMHPPIAPATSASYRPQSYEYKTDSPVLAAQVGSLATLLGYAYNVDLAVRPEREPAYCLNFVVGHVQHDQRQNGFAAQLHSRMANDEWVYDIECVGLHNFVCGIGNVVCHNTNEPEYRRLENNEFMEALKDRTVRIDIPYVTRLRDEVRIYERDFNRRKVRVHIAPHTLEVAAMWAVLTRLEDPKKPNLTLLQKLKLYNGKTLPGFTEDNIKELRKEAVREGMEGISARYIQDKISNALVTNQEEGYINPFMVINELESGLKNHALISSEDDRKRYRDLLATVREEYTEIVKNEVQRAISADEEAIKRLCGNYIDNIKAYTQREKLRNRYTGQYEEPDERLMRSIEEKIDIPESRKDDFRREIMNYIGALAIEGKTFDYRTNERLHKALELKLFEDQKDSIKLTSLVSRVIDKDTQEKIDVVKARLIRDFGYNEQSATDVLNYVASIFARGDTKGSY